PKVRNTAYMAAMMAVSFSTAEQVLALMNAAESDPDPNARRQAGNAWAALHAGISNGRGVELSAIQDLERIAVSAYSNDRVRAVRALGSIRARVPETYLKLLQDTDPRLKLAAIDASARMMSSLSTGSGPMSDEKYTQQIGPALVELLIADKNLQEPVGL